MDDKFIHLFLDYRMECFLYSVFIFHFVYIGLLSNHIQCYTVIAHFFPSVELMNFVLHLFRIEHSAANLAESIQHSGPVAPSILEVCMTL